MANDNLTRLKEREAQLRLKLVEAAVDFYATLGLLDPRDLQAELDGWGTFPQMAPPYYRQSQKRGEVLPVYTTEQQLRLLRDRSRKIRAENEFAICAVENRKSYVVGRGFSYRAAAARQECPASLLRRVQDVLDWWAEANDLGEYEADVMDRLDTDGDSFTRFFPQKSGLLLMRPVEPEHVRSPQGDAYGPEYSFGVQTDPEDVEDIKGYWIVERPLEDPFPAFVPADRVMHLKLNVSRSAKRGLPTFYPVEQNLRRAEDLLGSMTSMAKTRAKIALIRKFNGIMKSTVQSMTDELTEGSVADPSTGNAINLERFRFGTILNSSGGIDYEMPGADIQASDFVAVLQAELRAVAARLCMPEWMLTADASNANYSSSLVAEAPSTKMFERLQRLLARKFGENRYKGRESAAWRQIRHAVKVGLLPREVYRLVKVQVEAPSLVVRDRSGEASRNVQYLKARVKSRQTICQEEGLDYDQEQHNFRLDDERQPRQQEEQPGQSAATARQALGESETRTDRLGREYCVEPGQGRVDCQTGEPVKTEPRPREKRSGGNTSRARGAGDEKKPAPGKGGLAAYPKPAARNGRDADASGLSPRGGKVQNAKPWNPHEKAQSIGSILEEVDGGKPGSWTQQNATVMEKVFAEALNFDHWGGTYPADIAGVVKIDGKPTRVGIDLKTAVLGTTGHIKKDDNAESLKLGFVTEESDAAGFGKAASLSGNENASIHSLMFFLAVNANARVKEVQARDPKTGKPLKDESGQPVMQKAGLLYLQAGIRGSDYSRMVPIEVEGLNDVSDLTKPEVLAKVREKILEEIRATDPAAFAAQVKQSGEQLHTRLVRERSRQDSSLEAAGIELDDTSKARAEAGRAMKQADKAKAKAKEATKKLQAIQAAAEADPALAKKLKALGLL